MCEDEGYDSNLIGILSQPLLEGGMTEEDYIKAKPYVTGCCTTTQTVYVLNAVGSRQPHLDRGELARALAMLFLRCGPQPVNPAASP